jgi:selenocysteine lyase/cysteine desulfurase
VAIRRERLESLDCTPVGWNSVRGAYRFDQSEIDLKPDASRFEIGSSNLMGFCSLRGSLSIFLEILRNHGRGSIASRVLNLAAELGEELRAAGATTLPKVAPVERSGIVPFGVPGVSPSQFRQSAADHSVAVSCRGIGIRASIHAYNDRSDIERLIEVVRRATNR